MSETVTTNVTRAPKVKREPNAVTKADWSTLSIARPPSVATKATGAASISCVNSGASAPNSIANAPQTIPAVYCR